MISLLRSWDQIEQATQLLGSRWLFHLVTRLLHKPNRGLGLESWPRTRKGFATVRFPIAVGRAPRKEIPRIVPMAKRVAMPGRMHLQWRQAELFPNLTRVLHEFFFGQ